jgi:citrate lyase beta subunit
LDHFTAADKRLNAARKEREDALGNVKKRLEPLRRVNPLDHRRGNADQSDHMREDGAIGS